MRINKEKLEALARLPDDKLWEEIVSAASAYGVSLPRTAPPKETLENLRATVLGGKLNVGDAVKILNKYRKEGKK